LILAYWFYTTIHTHTHTGDRSLSTPSLMDVQIAGRRLHYIEKGKGQSVVFVHSSLTDYRSWQFQMESSSRKYRVISYSRRFAYPNKNVEDENANNTIEGNSADLAELTKKLGASPAHLIGHSSGAFVALYCAYHNPQLAKTLVLGEPSVFQLLANSHFEDDAQLFQSYRDNGVRPVQGALDHGNDEKAVRLALDVAMGMQNVFDHIPEQTRKLLMDNTRGLQGELESEMTFPFTLQDAKKVAVPTLFVKGEQSPRLFDRITDILSSNMPNTEQVTIPGVTHDLGRTTKSDIFNAKVLEFLAKHG
jgi:pimeloyl-ACP methyl ester carboxylesterase